MLSFLRAGFSGLDAEVIANWLSSGDGFPGSKVKEGGGAAAIEIECCAYTEITQRALFEPKSQLPQGHAAANSNAPLPPTIGCDKSAHGGAVIIEPFDHFASLDEKWPPLDAFAHLLRVMGGAVRALQKDSFAGII